MGYGGFGRGQGLPGPPAARGPPGPQFRGPTAATVADVKFLKREAPLEILGIAREACGRDYGGGGVRVYSYFDFRVDFEPFSSVMFTSH